MPPKSLAKAKSRLAPRIQTTDPWMRLVTTWEHNWWNWIKPLIELSGSNKSWRCSKTMPKGPLVDKWHMWKCWRKIIHKELKVIQNPILMVVVACRSKIMTKISSIVSQRIKPTQPFKWGGCPTIWAISSLFHIHKTIVLKLITCPHFHTFLVVSNIYLFMFTLKL
jgi:hypothetical protein